MNRSLAKLILKIIGWKVEGSLPDPDKKYIVVMAPHTSNWDFVLGWLGYAALGYSSKYLIKKEAFFFPLGILVKNLGGIPIDRKHSSQALHEVITLFRNSRQVLLTVTPEGTRSLNRHWKRGFYHLSQQAGVPLILGFLDYKSKTGGLGPSLDISGDFKKDMEFIEAFYKTKTAKYPENFNLSPENLESEKENPEKFEII